MSLDAHLEHLKRRHAALDARIVDEHGRPRPDGIAIVQLKRQKLRLKEEMERLRRNAAS